MKVVKESATLCNSSQKTLFTWCLGTHDYGNVIVRSSRKKRAETRKRKRRKESMGKRCVKKRRKKNKRQRKKRWTRKWGRRGTNVCNEKTGLDDMISRLGKIRSSIKDTIQNVKGI